MIGIYRRLTLETDARPDYSNLSLLSRRVIDAFLRLHDRDREYMIALDWLGFDSTSIEIEGWCSPAGRLLRLRAGRLAGQVRQRQLLCGRAIKRGRGGHVELAVDV
jgi:hypothetical protein